MHVRTVQLVLDAACQTMLTDAYERAAPARQVGDAVSTIRCVVEASGNARLAEGSTVLRKVKIAPDGAGSAELHDRQTLDLDERQCADALRSFLAQRQAKAAEALVFDEEAGETAPAPFRELLATAHEVLCDLAAELTEGEEHEVELVHFMGQTIKWAHGAGISVPWLNDEPCAFATRQEQKAHDQARAALQNTVSGMCGFWGAGSA